MKSNFYDLATSVSWSYYPTNKSSHKLLISDNYSLFDSLHWIPETLDCDLNLSVKVEKDINISLLLIISKYVRKTYFDGDLIYRINKLTLNPFFLFITKTLTTMIAKWKFRFHKSWHFDVFLTKPTFHKYFRQLPPFACWTSWDNLFI